jgi:hypothetical protein
MRLFRSVPSSDFACCPPFPPSAQSLALLPSLSIDQSIHPSAPQARSFPRRRQARSFPPSFLPFPSFLALALVCAVRAAVPGPVPGRPGDFLQNELHIFFFQNRGKAPERSIRKEQRQNAKEEKCEQGRQAAFFAVTLPQAHLRLSAAASRPPPIV